MTEKMNKIQIRAEVFSSLNSVLSPNGDSDNTVEKVVEKLKNIEDKDFLTKLLIKEFIESKDSERSALISLLLLNCIQVEDLEKQLWSNLSLKTVPDEKKYQLIDILKSMGKFIEYDKYLDYFEEPQKIVEMDTQKLLSSALLNPDAQIDFLDFMETLSKSDKQLLIQAMIEDYSKDDLANIIAPIILCEKDEQMVETIIKELINTKSALSYYPLKRFCELSKNEAFVRLANKGLKELQLAGINEEKSELYYNNRFNNSILYNCYASLPDGKGNIGMIFSRIRSDNSIQMFCTVINDIKGITDCFGFSGISPLEFSLIIKKFAGNEEPYKLTFEMGLKWLDEAEKRSFETDNILPYEYVCWKEILYDVPKTLFNENDIIEKSLNILPKKECDLEEIYKSDYLSKLFFTINDNKNFDELTNKIDEELSTSQNFDLKNIENLLKENISVIFDEKTENIFKQRIQKTAFILMANSKNKHASQLYNLSSDKNLLKEFYLEVLKKSLFVFYQQEFQNKMNVSNDNIFLKKSQKQNTKLSSVELKELLEKILEKWGKDE